MFSAVFLSIVWGRYVRPHQLYLLLLVGYQELLLPYDLKNLLQTKQTINLWLLSCNWCKQSLELLWRWYLYVAFKEYMSILFDWYHEFMFVCTTWQIFSNVIGLRFFRFRYVEFFSTLFFDTAYAALLIQGSHQRWGGGWGWGLAPPLFTK